MDNIKNIGIYIRLSVKDANANNEKESNSIKSQRLMLNDYISKSNEFSKCNVYEYVDENYSGTNFNRPKIKQLLDDVRSKKIDCIIVKDISRFGRNYIEVGNYLENVFPFLNIRFIAVNDKYDSSNTETVGDIESVFKTIMADLYAREVSVKVKKARENLIKNGKYLYKNAMGYIKSKDDKYMICPNSECDWIIKYIFEQVASGRIKSELCIELNNREIPTPNRFYYSKSDKKENEKTFWNQTKIQLIIKNPIYVGDYYNNGVLIKENAHEPIVDRELFNLANSKYRTNKKSNEPRKKNLLTPIMKCDICDYKMKISSHNKHYVCISYKINDTLECTNTRISIVRIKKSILLHLKKINKISQSKKELLKSSNNKIMLDSLNSELKNKSDELNRWNIRFKELLQSKVNTTLCDTEFSAKNDLIQSKRNELNQEIGTIKEKISQTKIAITQDENTLSNNFNISNIEEFTDDILVSLVDEIRVVNNDLIRIKLKFSDKFQKIKLEN